MDKAEFKAEQVVTDADAVNILVSLTDTRLWQLKGIRNANLFSKHKWIKSIKKAEPGYVWITYPSGTCGTVTWPRATFSR